MAKWCIVTGATSGIGRELALLAAADGFSLIVASRSGERLRSAADEFRRAGSPEVLFFPMDLSSAKAAQMLWAYAQEKGITPEILVNNAGFGVYTDAADADNLERVTRMMGLNVEALTVLSMLAAHAMREAGNGRILNVASVAAFAACPKLAAYAATKSYVLSFSRALAEELKSTGVTVTALCPGYTLTHFADAAGVAPSAGSDIIARSAREAALTGWKALRSGKPVVIDGALNRLCVGLIRLLPAGFVTRIAGRILTRFARAA